MPSDPAVSQDRLRREADNGTTISAASSASMAAQICGFERPVAAAATGR